MAAIFYTYSFLIGLIAGSFYNVVGLRVPKKESIVRPGSHCSHCQRKLTIGELIPVVSYLFLKGKCKGCGHRISPIYPLIELVNAALFVAAPIILGWSSELAIAWLLISLLTIITVSDIAYMLIPDKILLFFGTIFILLRFFVQPAVAWWEPLAGAAAGFGLLLLIAILSKGGMGGGDIKLFAVLGWVLGWKLVLIAFVIAAFYGTILGLIGMIAGRVRVGKPMPFAPAIAMGTLTAYFFGERFLHWYYTIIAF
ncbi:prepilin peptidase [Paenibacillus montanisoli]|uniref:Prepilin leader peptidase/N-methyltransferase n=1 Tax=Paenibacillus montanisoli TaxID=2081970 RepID=A0A328U4G0_9BACL|nr:A24 family peptidase [Paenibacillus montanisoli]RAP74746.1 prepilin peptidase [Paenibacillus montanisoli]